MKRKIDRLLTEEVLESHGGGDESLVRTYTKSIVATLGMLVVTVVVARFLVPNEPEPPPAPGVATVAAGSSTPPLEQWRGKRWVSADDSVVLDAPLSTEAPLRLAIVPDWGELLLYPVATSKEGEIVECDARCAVHGLKVATVSLEWGAHNQCLLTFRFSDRLGLCKSLEAELVWDRVRTSRIQTVSTKR